MTQNGFAGARFSFRGAARRGGIMLAALAAFGMPAQPLAAQVLPPSAAADGAGAAANQQLTSTEAPLEAISGYYKLGPMDVISVVVEGHAEFSDTSVLVPSDGRIYLPVAGSMAINGMTVAQVRAQITKRLSSRLREPRVTVSLRSLRSISSGYINVVGDAVRPTILQIRNGWRLTEIVARVGGLNARLEETQATLARVGSGVQKIDLYQAVSRPLSKANVRLKPNDVLSIMLVEPVILIGEVKRPGSYPWKGASTVLSAINKAGGLNQVPSDSEAYIVRRERRINIKLQNVLSFKPGAGFALQPGDVLSVEAVQPVILIGGVEKPASYSWQSASTLVNAVNKAGGLTKTARESRGYIVRQNRKIEVRLQDALDFKDPKANVALQPGDVVNVEAIPQLRVQVLGALARVAGSYQVEPGEGVLEAVLKAGGPTAPIEQVSATLRRGAQVIPIDMRRLLIATDPEANIPLLEGDVVTLGEVDAIRVQVMGRVATPGLLRLKPQSTLNDALGQAGGLVMARDSTLISISILRRVPGGNDVILRINPITLANGSDPGQNARLRDGDIIAVAEVKARTVFLSGEVARPGVYPIEEGEGVPELLTRVGAVTPTAALTQVIVRRDDKIKTVDVYGALKNAEKGPTFPLQDGDFVVVPRNKSRVLVIGAVGQPNFYPIPERGSLTVLEAIVAAGYSVQGTRGKEVAVIRQRNGKESQRFAVPLDQIGKGNISAGNFVLQAGDVVYVPPAGQKASVLQQIPSYLGYFNLFRSFGF